MASAAPAAPAVPPASSVENRTGGNARFADKLPEEINEMKIKDEKIEFTVVFDRFGFRRLNLLLFSIVSVSVEFCLEICV